MKIFNNQKKNGTYYTPSGLAEFLIKPLISKSQLTYFDPSYGNGALLETIERILSQMYPSFYNYDFLYGCDINPIDKKIDNIPKSNLHKINFFKYSDSNKFDNIVMNPPYVRNNNIDPETKETFEDLLKKNKLSLNNKSDIWVYFLIKAINHLCKEGNVGAIIPWSFFQADYSINLRRWLFNMFKEIKIIALGKNYFSNTDERIILLWLKNFGTKTKLINFCFANDYRDVLKFKTLSKNEWESPIINFTKNNDVDELINVYKSKYGFQKFREIADIRIGIVTGANKFFIKKYAEAKKLGFHPSHTIPIYTSTKELNLLSTERRPKNRLLIIHPNNFYKYIKYIKEGLGQEIHLRAHSKLRDHWFYIKKQKNPDAFFHYRSMNVPFLVFNTKYQCTNSIHRVYFKNLTENEKKWIQISLLSTPGLLSIEKYSKIYGSGVLKIEPGSLYNSIVYKCNDNIDMQYKNIAQEVTNKNMNMAVELATNLIKNKLKIEDEMIKKTNNSYNEIKNRRVER